MPQSPESPDADVDGHQDGPRPGPRSRSRLEAAVVLGAIGVAGLLAAGAYEPAPAQEPVPPAVQLLRDEIDEMIAAGIPADNPKVRMLIAEADDLELDLARSNRPAIPIDPLADTGGGARADTPDEATRQADEVGAEEPAQRGAVDCEPIPQLLEAAEVLGARCLSVPQADGSSRYVAVTPDGTVHTVAFRPGGAVERLPDTTVPTAAIGPDVEVVPSASDGIELRRGAQSVGTVDLG